MMIQKIKSGLAQILKFSFGLGIFIYFVASGHVDLAKIQRAFFSSPWILLSLSLGFLILVISTVRWRILKASQGIRLSFKQTLKLVFIGHFFNIVIPGTVSGDLVKVYYMTRRKDKKMAAGFSVFMDRFVGLFMMVILTFAAVLLNYSFIRSIPELAAIGRGVIMAFGISLGGLIFFLFKKEFKLSPRWPDFIRNSVTVFWAYRNHLPAVSKAGAITILTYVTNVLFFYTVAKALGENFLPLSQYFFLVPIGLFVMVVPIAPAGLGVGQGMFLMLFQWAYGQPVTIGADIITLYQLVIVCWALVGLVIYVFHRQEASEISSEEEVVVA